MTISEKILSRAAGKTKVDPGEVVFAEPDMVVINDSLGPTVVRSMFEMGVKKPWNPKKVVINFDHFVPAMNQGAADGQAFLRKFAKETGVNFIEVGSHGINHQVTAERGFARPGMLYVGDDTHATALGAFGAFAAAVGFETSALLAMGEIWFRIPESIRIKVRGSLRKGVMPRDLIAKVSSDLGSDGAAYKALEFVGPGIDSMSMDGRMTVCSLAPHPGAKTAIIAADDRAIDYVKSRTREEFEVVKSDPDASYCDELDYDMSTLEPRVAAPPSPTNGKAVEEVAGTRIDQGFIGSCADGRLEGLEVAARILRDKKVSPDCRLVVIPASQEVLLEATKAGYIETLVKAGAAICSPSCGPCPGFHSGLLGKDEVCISTSTLNSPGRMGSRDALVYLASPATVAASALEGRIADPRPYLEDG